MALVKTDYGLVYNDDGSLCTTIREDDVPFSGVKSFAVEEGTENLITEYFTAYSGMTIIEHQDTTIPDGKYFEIIYDSVSSSSSRALFEYNDNDLIEGTSIITISFWGKGDESSIGDKIRVYTGSEWLTIDEPLLTTEWQRFIITCTYNGQTSTAGIQINTPNEGQKFYIHSPQVEAKSFATSFVDGTRQDGRFYIPLDKLGFDPATDDFVIAYWKKPIATDSGDLTGYNLFSIGKSPDGYMWWGKNKDGNYFKLNVLYDNGEYESSDSPTFTPDWYFNNWHFEVLRKADGVIDYFVDGIKQCSLALATNLQTFVEGLTVGGYFNNSDNNSLIASLAFGYAKDDNGNLQWTDEFIQELYNARKPFSVPPRLPIL